MSACYYLGGKVAGGDRPCNDGAGYPTCCADPSLCTNGGLCFEGHTLYDPGTEVQYAFGRGPCTNLSSPNCLKICLDTLNEGAGVWACNDELTTFCCDDSSVYSYAGNGPRSRTCCTDGSPTFQLPTPINLTSTTSSGSSLRILSFSSSSLSKSSSSSSFSSSSFSSSSSSSFSSSSSSSLLSSSSSFSSSSVLTTSLPAPSVPLISDVSSFSSSFSSGISSTSRSSSSVTSSSSPLSTATLPASSTSTLLNATHSALPSQSPDRSEFIAIGLGVGIPLAVAILAILYCFLRHRRRSRRDLTVCQKPNMSVSNPVPVPRPLVLPERSASVPELDCALSELDRRSGFRQPISELDPSAGVGQALPVLCELEASPRTNSGREGV